MANGGKKSGAMAMTQGIKAKPESAEQAVSRFSVKELYGYGELDHSFSLHDSESGETKYLTRPVAMLAKEQEGKKIESLCVALMQRLGVMNGGEKITRSILFRSAGSSDNSGDVQPQEIKYAVLRLLGMTAGAARSASNYSTDKQPAYSESFTVAMKRIKRERILYPLKHPDEFEEYSELKSAREWVAQYTKYGLSLENIFAANLIPPLYPDRGHKQGFQMLLNPALHAIHTILDGASTEIPDHDMRVVKRLLSKSTLEILEKVERERAEKLAQQTPLGKKLG